MNPSPNYMRSRSGQFIHFDDPSPASFKINDIAHGLSRAPRWVGQSSVFYSVAQHSVWVSQQCTNPNHALTALMHDASEAFLCDLPAGLKALCPEYKKIEDKFNVCIALRYGLTFPWPQEVKEADTLALFVEAERLNLGSPAIVWPGTKFEDREHARISQLAFMLTPLDQDEARRLFLDRFEELL